MKTGCWHVVEMMRNDFPVFFLSAAGNDISADVLESLGSVLSAKNTLRALGITTDHTVDTVVLTASLPRVFRSLRSFNCRLQLLDMEGMHRAFVSLAADV
jgi:hypothetical protein